jgi:hypothetical protein
MEALAAQITNDPALKTLLTNLASTLSALSTSLAALETLGFIRRVQRATTSNY